jgi:hypothetical protein
MPDGLFFFFEGPDDARFVDAIVVPVALGRYKWTGKYEYACKRTWRICTCLSGLQNIPADYVFLTDMNASPCVSHRRVQIVERYPAVVEERVIVAAAEIEAWYLAGIDVRSASQLGMEPLERTDHITKEGFDRLIPPSFESRIDFMSEILKRYSLDTARQNNRSFDYLMSRLLGT